MPGMGFDSLVIDPVASIVTANPSTIVMALAEFDITVAVIAKTEYKLSAPAAHTTYDCTIKKDMTCTLAYVQIEFTGTDTDGFMLDNGVTTTETTVFPSSEVVLQTASGQNRAGRQDNERREYECEKDDWKCDYVEGGFAELDGCQSDRNGEYGS
ncbi:hypothetical protein PSPO01_16258 [Paraphaeosphaeria sporulosa]